MISVVVRLIQILFGLHLPVITALVATATATTKAREGSELKGDETVFFFLNKNKTKKEASKKFTLFCFPVSVFTRTKLAASVQPFSHLSPSGDNVWTFI